jgi:tRNA pseudouridine55 synthase
MFFLINKEKGKSSFKTIKDFAKKNNIKKIGHTGTLDPMATGLLLVATDEDTKLINYIDKGYKTYLTKIKFGYKSNTYDSTGNIEKTFFDSNENKVKKTILSFQKFYNQMPPIFSAKKINGQKAYQLARKGQKVNLKKARVEIKKIKNIKKINFNTYQFEVTVSRGTYIRSLIYDIGKKLNSDAIMIFLNRSKIGNLSFKDIDKKINIKDLLSIKIFKINNIFNFLDGKKITIELEDGDFALEMKNEIVGIVTIKNKKVIKRKLFGKKCKRLIDESSKISQ